MNRILLVLIIFGVSTRVEALNGTNSNTLKSVASNVNKRTTESEYIFLVSIQETSGSSIHFCSGVILSRFWILSAAHCLDGYPEHPVGLIIKAGISKSHMLSNKQIRFVERIFYPPEYNISGILGIDNDVALLKLSESLIFSTTVGAINVYNSGTLIERDAYEVLGWGAISEDSYEAETDLYLYRAAVKYDDILECKRYINVLTGKFCHGGILVLYASDVQAYWIVGITSFGSRYCDTKNPISFTKISIYFKWIDKINEELL